jgi:type IV fimbrial biogenesis protein FimT
MRSGISSGRGFTLIELLVALAISAILLAIAVPSYSGSRLNSQLRASANDLIGSINLSRSEAIKGGSTVTLCASSDGATCGGAWNEGWVVLRGADVLHTVSSVPNGFHLTESSGTTTLRFQSTGVDATPAVFTLCRSGRDAGGQQRLVSMDATGRAFVKRMSAGVCS